MGPFQIIPDEDLAVGFRQAQIQQPCERTWMKDVSGSNKTLNIPQGPISTFKTGQPQLPEPQIAPL